MKIFGIGISDLLIILGVAAVAVLGVFLYRSGLFSNLGKGAPSVGLRFCPHCGAENATGASFCGKCGKPFPSGGANFAARLAAAPAAGMSLAAKLAIGCTAAAILFACLPWLHTPQTLTTASNMGSIFLGEEYRIQPDYCVWQFPQLGRVADGYIDMVESAAGSHALSVTNPEHSTGGAYTMALFAWGVCLFVIFLGLISALSSQGRRTIVLAVGLLLLALCSFVYTFWMYGDLAPVAVGFPTNALLCGLAALAGAVLCFAARSPQR